MEGYDVLDPNDDSLGKVVEIRGENLVVEHGTLRKTRRPLPRTFAKADDDAGVVRVSVSREIFEGAPAVEDGAFDEAAVAEYYGLTPATGEPAHEDYGSSPGEPAETAEQDRALGGQETTESERARIHSSIRPEGTDQTQGTAGRQILPLDPHR